MLSFCSLCRPHESTFQCPEQTAEQSRLSASVPLPDPTPVSPQQYHITLSDSRVCRPWFQKRWDAVVLLTVSIWILFLSVFSWIYVEKDLQVIVFCFNLIFYTAFHLFFGTKIAWICSSSALQWVSAHCSAASLQLNCFRFTLSALMFSATAGACVFLRNSSRISTWQTQLELESW